MDFDEAADALYGGSPDAFTGRRKELADAAKQAGDAALAKRIGGLRKPTMSAWAVNLAAHRRPELVGELLAVGVGLREAWSGGAALGDWERRRGEVVSEASRTAVGLAAEEGHPLGPGAQREVEQTFEAAVIDPEAGDAVREGRLDKPLSYAGFAVPAGPIPQAKPPVKEPRKASKATEKGQGVETERRKAVGKDVASRKGGLEKDKAAAREAEARRKAVEAQQAVEEAQRSYDEWREHVAEARRELNEAAAEEERLRADLEAVRRRRQAAEKRVGTGEREQAQARRALETARQRAARLAP